MIVDLLIVGMHICVHYCLYMNVLKNSCFGPVPSQEPLAMAFVSLV